MQQSETAPQLERAQLWALVSATLSFGVFVGWAGLSGGASPLAFEAAAFVGLGLAVGVWWMVRLFLTDTRMALFTMPTLAGVAWAFQAPEQRFMAIFAIAVYIVWLQLATEKREGSS